MKLDFENYSKIKYGYLIIPSPPEKLKIDLEIYDRFCGVIYMAVHVGGESDKYFISKKAKDASYIRASLCDFVSIEEYIKQSYPDLNIENYRFYKSTNPIFHMLKLLRNYNIHLSDSTLANKSMMVRIPKDGTDDFEIQVEFISNLSIPEIRKLYSAKDYTDQQLQKMIECFEKEQHEFGVSALIIKSALDYAEKIERALQNSVA